MSLSKLHHKHCKCIHMYIGIFLGHFCQPEKGARGYPNVKHQHNGQPQHWETLRPTLSIFSKSLIICSCQYYRTLLLNFLILFFSLLFYHFCSLALFFSNECCMTKTDVGMHFLTMGFK